MVSITILVLLASAVLFGLAGVQRSAKAQRTKSQIARLHEMVIEAWESVEELQTPSPPAGSTLEAAALLRLKQMRALSRMELPDRGTDVIPAGVDVIRNNPLPYFGGAASGLAGVSPGAIYYQRFIQRYTRPPNISASEDYDWFTENASSECLYMIISRLQAAGASGLESLSARDVGDTDTKGPDGMPEILDAWGKPIYFIRWPAGFIPQPDSNSQIPLENVSEMQDGKPATAGDVFDNYHADPTAYFVFPLVASGGPDGELALFNGLKNRASSSVENEDRINYTNPSQASSTNDPTNINNPYMVIEFDSGTPQAKYFWRLGHPIVGIPGLDYSAVGTWSDNIHNHSLSVGDK